MVAPDPILATLSLCFSPFNFLFSTSVFSALFFTLSLFFFLFFSSSVSLTPEVIDFSHN